MPAATTEPGSASTLVITPGSSVRFPNDDPILHNVFSIGGRNAFDLGLAGRGPAR